MYSQTDHLTVRVPFYSKWILSPFVIILRIPHCSDLGCHYQLYWCVSHEVGLSPPLTSHNVSSPITRQPVITVLPLSSSNLLYLALPQRWLQSTLKTRPFRSAPAWQPHAQWIQTMEFTQAHSTGRWTESVFPAAPTAFWAPLCSASPSRGSLGPASALETTSCAITAGVMCWPAPASMLAVSPSTILFIFTLGSCTECV